MVRIPEIERSSRMNPRAIQWLMQDMVEKNTGEESRRARRNTESGRKRVVRNIGRGKIGLLVGSL